MALLASLPDSMTLHAPPWPPFSGRCVAVEGLDVRGGATAEPHSARLRLELEELPDGGQRPWNADTHVVRPGQTLMGIAHEHYGDGSRWREIALLNDIRDPATLAPGTVLLVRATGQEGAREAGSGVSFPVEVDRTTGGIALAPAETDIEQAIHLILDTERGERTTQPQFGCTVYEAGFETMRASTHRTINRSVRDAIERWEPRVWVLAVQSDVSEWREGRIRVAIEYRLRHTGEVRSMVHPFQVIERETTTRPESGATVSD